MKKAGDAGRNTEQSLERLRANASQAEKSISMPVVFWRDVLVRVQRNTANRIDTDV